MSTVLRFRRGDTTAANAFTGAEGELFVDTTKDTLVVHDGVTAGGKPLATESYVTTQIGSLNLFSGSYNDLTNKPTIPTTTSQLMNDVGYITSSALSGYATESYVGTQLSSKQDTLVSGTNIKSINGTSLLGSGNIIINTNVLTYGEFTDNTTTTVTTSQQELDAFSASTYRTSKYIVQAVSSSGIHSTEVLLTHDGTTVYITEYATIYTSSPLFTLDANISYDQVRLLVTPSVTDITFDVVRTSLAARTGGAGESSAGDMMSLTGSEDLQAGSGTEDLNT